MKWSDGRTEEDLTPLLYFRLKPHNCIFGMRIEPMIRDAVQRSRMHRIRIAGHALPSSRATATATPTRSPSLISTFPTQSRHYALSRYPDRSNRFTRSNSSSHRKQQDSSQEQDAHIILPPHSLHNLPQLPKDPNGVLQLDSNKGAANLLGQSSLIVTREIEMMK